MTASKVYLEAEDKPKSRENVLELLREIEKGTLIGRVVASRTEGIAGLYPEKVKLKTMLDKKAVDEEDLYKIELNHFTGIKDNIEDKRLLYDEIFVLENLGICIFTSL
ncbi:hypothetical protein [Clostridium sp. C105KSO13]|uniref:hypothetical protein n=1 Tax=Clostridium sp. C105KSO13 TaxID=1776045 RepID=UPI0007405CFE|nr:hypothetical protein [Clostridium sp. C105KSO13]CUX20588.1 hypothetical protein BN3456_00424 [Clostridium sp. C105KSO13]